MNPVSQPTSCFSQRVTADKMRKREVHKIVDLGQISEQNNNSLILNSHKSGGKVGLLSKVKIGDSILKNWNTACQLAY